MEQINIEYLKISTTEEEFEIEQFWIDIRKELYKIEFDHSQTSYSIRRESNPAYFGEFAGILCNVLLNMPQFTLATLYIWERISNHFKSKRENSKIVRMLNLTSLEILCKYDLISHKNIRNAEIIKSEVLVAKNTEDDNSDFLYEEILEKVDCAKITFENKKYQFEYTIASDGEITRYEKNNRNLK